VRGPDCFVRGLSEYSRRASVPAIYGDHVGKRYEIDIV